MEIILNSAVAGLKTAHLLEITVAFEFSVLTLTVPGLRLRKIQNPSCFRVPAPFSSSLTAEFRLNTLGSAHFWPNFREENCDALTPFKKKSLSARRVI